MIPYLPPTYCWNHQYFTKEQIESITRQDYILSRLNNQPTKLYKYFPNIVDQQTGRNFSVEALQKNTVYLQSPINFDDPYDSTICLDEYQFCIQRLKYYCDLCEFPYDETWDYRELVNEFAKYLNALDCKTEEEWERVFKVKGLENDVLDLTHRFFAKTLQVWLFQRENQNEMWLKCINVALHQEYESVQDNLAGIFKISCFTTTPFSMLMWAHYANSHKGFCIEYDFPQVNGHYQDISMNLFPVIYSNVRVSVLEHCLIDLKSPTVTDEVLWPIYKYGLLAKSLYWLYQDEWRLVSCDDLLADQPNYNSTFSPITRVYLGAKMSDENRKKIAGMCKEKKIPVSCVMPTTMDYSMQECGGRLKADCILGL